MGLVRTAFFWEHLCWRVVFGLEYKRVLFVSSLRLTVMTSAAECSEGAMDESLGTAIPF